MAHKIFSSYKYNQYKNPFRREERKISQRIKLDIFLLIVCIVLWFYFLLFSPFFTFEKIDINIDKEFQEKPLIEEQINNYFNSAYFFSLSKKNYFFFNEDKLKQELLNKYFFIEDIKIEKKFPNYLLISVEKKKPHFILKLPYETFYLDLKGIVLEKHSLEEAEKQEGAPEIKILVNKDNELNITNRTFSENFLKFIDEIYNLLKKNNQNIEFFEAVNIDQTQGTIKAKLNGNGYLFLNTSLTPQSQIENFLTVYKEKIQPRNKQFEYIDLRFGDRVYIK